jgi:hypothetical protein
MLSTTASMLYSLMSLIRRDFKWHLRVRRYSDDPMGPVVYEEVFESKKVMRQRLPDLRKAIAWEQMP